ncbi:serine/threonine-protein phosphatase 4 regulatory subunit 2-like isoform X2 [Ornithorhynchus anatinus]|uniref:serine/threonine-protein phosphatase 4 regulatory subunit 2-like isoform X2 n=1 Tax=Ornithorhynchus anatinus TaxID=9258 RepID=UPI0019D471D5|nr:serine/threonine-protein phosphatase 4 regulatory subunit 2-like isoform X2 [Ornithorhynchus anatinus]
MNIEKLLEALKDFENGNKKEVSPVLDQFLCHVAKTGQTMIQWAQFKGYFIFKLERVMDDFRIATPEPRGTTHANMEYIPFDEMKERILKIVTGFNGIPFTIQRLCELITEPKKNYTGTDKFLRGVEKNVMVVSCVYPSTDESPISDSEGIQEKPLKNKPGLVPVKVEGREAKRVKFDKEGEIEVTNQTPCRKMSSNTVEDAEVSTAEKKDKKSYGREHFSEEKEKKECIIPREMIHDNKNKGKNPDDVLFVNENTSHRSTQMEESNVLQAEGDFTP